MALWLKADVGVITKENKVIEWKDQSGNNRNAYSTASLNPPQIVANELNNLPVIKFNGLNEGLETKEFQTFLNKRATIIVVANVFGPSKSLSSGTNSIISTFFGKGVTWQLFVTNELLGYYDGVGAAGSPITGIIHNRWDLITLNKINDSTMRLYRNGDATTHLNIHNNQADSNKLKIGSSGKGEILNGEIAEIIIYNKSLNDEEIKQVNNYLMTKYQIKLPPKPFTQTIWFYITIVAAIILLTFFATKYFTNKSLKRKLEEFKRLQEMDIERQRISREMHDDIGAGLTQIALMSESLKSKNFAAIEADAIANTSRKLVSSISEIIWSLNGEYKTLQDLLNYLREQLNNLLEYAEVEYSIDFPVIETKIIVTNQQRRNVLLSVKETVNNAIKYSKAQQISIVATFKNNNLCFKITDNGIGFDTIKKYSGNGLKNIQYRIKEMGGEITIKSSINNGSTFEFCITIT